MSETENYLIEVLSLMPTGSHWAIYTTDDNFEQRITGVSFKKLGLDYVIELSKNGMSEILEVIHREELVDHIQQCELKAGDVVLFKGYDYMEYGVISGAIKLPERFVRDYINSGMCQVATDW